MKTQKLNGRIGTQMHNHIIHKRTFNHLAKLASHLTLKHRVKELLDIQATAECNFTLNEYVT